MSGTLKELRNNAFLSQRDLADKADLTVATICRIEKGVHKPMKRTIRKLAEALNVSPGDILFK